MSLIWLDNFEYTDGYDYWVGDAPPVYLAPSKKRHDFHTMSLRGTSNDTESCRGYMIKPTTTLIAGCGFYTGFGTATQEKSVLQFATFDETVSNRRVGVELVVTTGNKIQINGPKSNSTNRLGYVDHKLLPDQWYYFEIKATCSDSAGVVTVRLNGQQIFHITGVDTRPTEDSAVDDFYTIVSLGRYRAYNDGIVSNISLASEWSDFYICDDQGNTNNDFLGDIRVAKLYPNANGSVSSFTGSDGNSTDNYLLINETTLDRAKFVESSGIETYDLYQFDKIPESASGVVGMVSLSLIEKDSGNAYIYGGNFLKSGVTTSDSGRQPLVFKKTDTTWHNRSHIPIDKNFVDNSSWTQTSINEMEYGIGVKQ